tara:strand:+ start:188 stop:742 length:555 start_codon:yes stop_codon:yes gene_type:complete
MIFSNSKREIYYLLSLLLKTFDIEIINNIYDKKKRLEDKLTLEWYINQGKIYKKYKEGIIINQILFNPYHENSSLLNIYHKKIFHLKILIETFNLKGFILIKEKNEYNLPSLKMYIKLLNNFLNMNGILEIYNKIFQYKINLTDLAGNRCIRSIIFINDNYEYKTIAIKKNNYIEPIDRLPTMI